MTAPALLEDARVELGMTVPDLWLDYFALGGTKTAAELGAYLTGGDADGDPVTSDADHDAMVHALNEAYDDRGGEHPLPYRYASAAGGDGDEGR